MTPASFHAQPPRCHANKTKQAFNIEAGPTHFTFYRFRSLIFPHHSTDPSIMKATLLFLATAAVSMGVSESFTAPHAVASRTRPTATSLSMTSSSNSNNNGKKNTFAASAAAAAFLLANVVSCSDAALAADVVGAPSSTSEITQSSSIVISARSGGRAGGRAAPRMMSRPSSSTTTRVINQRTTVIAPPPIVMGGGYGYGGYYDPTPGIGECLSLLSSSLLFLPS